MRGDAAGWPHDVTSSISSKAGPEAVIQGRNQSPTLHPELCGSSPAPQQGLLRSRLPRTLSPALKRTLAVHRQLASPAWEVSAHRTVAVRPSKSPVNSWKCNPSTSAAARRTASAHSPARCVERRRLKHLRCRRGGEWNPHSDRIPSREYVQCRRLIVDARTATRHRPSTVCCLPGSDRACWRAPAGFRGRADTRPGAIFAVHSRRNTTNSQPCPLR